MVRNTVAAGTGAPPADTKFVVPQLQVLVNTTGTQWNPIKDVKMTNIKYAPLTAPLPRQSIGEKIDFVYLISATPGRRSEPGIKFSKPRNV